MSEKRSVRATLIEIFTRLITVDKSKDGEVYWNGVNNLYPNEIEGIVNNSPTANRASKIMAKFFAGKGLTDESRDIIVNEKKNYKLSNVISISAKSAAKQGGAFIHVGFGFDDELKIIIPKTLDVLDYTKCRNAKEDDDNNEGKIFYKDYCDKNIFGGKKKVTKWFYPFNKDQAVVIAQIKADYEKKGGKPTEEMADMLPHYRGQVFYLNFTPEYKYALAPVDSVYNDADSEYRISLYINSQIRSGFLGKTIVITQGLDDEKAKEVDRDLGEWLGAENSQNLYHVDVEKADDLEKVLKIIQVKGQFDEKLFTETIKNLQSKILGAYNSIPEILVVSSSGALFGPSGETYEQAKIFYNEQTSDERWKLSETFTYLGFPCEIKPLVDIKTTLVTEPETDEISI